MVDVKLIPILVSDRNEKMRELSSYHKDSFHYLLRVRGYTVCTSIVIYSVRITILLCINKLWKTTDSHCCVLLIIYLSIIQSSGLKNAFGQKILVKG